MVGVPRPLTRDEFRTAPGGCRAALVAMAAVLSPYVAFNLRASGTIWPNTFYAKQAEYQTDMPVWTACGQVLSPTLAGAQAAPVAGVCLQRLPPAIPTAGAAQLAGHRAGRVVAGDRRLYALRLPVNYQHGRYTHAVDPLAYPVWSVGHRRRLLRPRSPACGCASSAAPCPQP